MMNSKLVQDEASRLAQRVLQDDIETNADRINALHEIVYGRVATAEDIDKCNQFLQRYRKLSLKDMDENVSVAAESSRKVTMALRLISLMLL